MLTWRLYPTWASVLTTQVSLSFYRCTFPRNHGSFACISMRMTPTPGIQRYLNIMTPRYWYTSCDVIGQDSWHSKLRLISNLRARLSHHPSVMNIMSELIPLMKISLFRKHLSYLELWAYLTPRLISKSNSAKYFTVWFINFKIAPALFMAECGVRSTA